jgi:hypothetical protein
MSRGQVRSIPRRSRRSAVRGCTARLYSGASRAYTLSNRRPRGVAASSVALLPFALRVLTAGQVLHTRTLGEPGLRRGGSHWSRRPEADLQILKEVGADIALVVRLRVGTYRKKAALEHRSIIRITTPEDQTILRARHSVLSDADVSKDSHFVPVAGRVVSVNPDEFTRELKAILPKFISLALVPSNK